MYQILSESTGIRERYDKTILVCFSVHNVCMSRPTYRVS